MADRYGRRLPLLVGVSIFTLASAACALAPSLEWLIAARFVQALGGCAGMVISRAVVRDLCDPIGAAKAFSQLMLVMGLAPILAPWPAACCWTGRGWQSIFVCLTLFAALAGLGVALWLPETIPADGERPPLSGALGQYRRLFADRLFLAYGLSGGVAMAGMFAYIAGSPYVFIQLYGIPAEHYGWLFGSNAAGFIVMAQVNARLLRYRGPAFWLRRIIWGYLACGLALLGIASLQPATLWPLLVPLFGCVASLGCIIPNASACAMAGQGQHAGSASALMGSLQFSVAAGASALVGVLHDGTAIPMTLVIAVCGAVATPARLADRAPGAPGRLSADQAVRCFSSGSTWGARRRASRRSTKRRASLSLRKLTACWSRQTCQHWPFGVCDGRTRMFMAIHPSGLERGFSLVLSARKTLTGISLPTTGRRFVYSPPQSASGSSLALPYPLPVGARRQTHDLAEQARVVAVVVADRLADPATLWSLLSSNWQAYSIFRCRKCWIGVRPVIAL